MSAIELAFCYAVLGEKTHEIGIHSKHGETMSFMSFSQCCHCTRRGISFLFLFLFWFGLLFNMSHSLVKVKDIMPQ